MTILIADGDDATRKLLRTFLRSEGYRTVEAQTGPEALVALRGATSPIVGLIGWELPIIDGMEVCRRASGWADASPMHLILLTNHASRTEILTGLASGANDYANSPFDRVELLARVRIGTRWVETQQALSDWEREMENVLDQVKLK